MHRSTELILIKYKHMNKNIISVILLLFPVVFHTMAQEVLTLEKTRELAVSCNENLRIANLQADKASQQLAAARTLRLPSFSASGTGFYQNKDFEMEMFLPTKVPDPASGDLVPNLFLHPVTGDPVIGPDGDPVFNMYAWLPLNISLSGAYLVGVKLEQPLYTGGRINAGNSIADIGVEIASENLSLQKANTLLAADDAYWMYVSVNQQVRLAEEALSMLDEYVELASNSHDVGMVSRNDVLKVQVEYNNAKLGLQKAQNGRELSRMELCRVTGLPFDTQVVAADSMIEIRQSLYDVSNEIDLEQRPEYQILKNNIRMCEENIKLVRADYLPAAGIQAGYNHIAGIEFSGTEVSNTSLNVMGSIKIPLFQWGQGARKVNAARLEKQINELELEKNRQLLQLESEKVRLNLQLAYERVRMNENALEQAKENLRVSRDNYELGMETITELLTAQTQWQEARSELIESKAGYRLKETEWLKASGRLVEGQ